MEITGKIIQKLEPVSGTSKTGNPWNKQEYVLETQDTFPRKVFFNFWGERANQFNLEVGQVVTVSFDLESREYNGRWYTDVRAWKAEPAQAQAQAQAAAPAPQQQGYPVATPQQPQVEPFTPEASESDDLPF